MYTSFLVCILTIITLLYLLLIRHYNYWKIKNVPHSKPILLLGSTLKLFLNKLCIAEFLCYLHQRNDYPYFGFYFFDRPSLLIKDVEHIKYILIKDFDHFSHRGMANNNDQDKIGSKMLFLNNNVKTWRDTRIKLTPVFTSGKMKNMLPLMLETSDDMIEFIKEKILCKKSMACRELSMKYTTDVITTCAFGIKGNCFKNEKAEFRIAAKRLFSTSFFRSIQMASYFIAPSFVNLFRMKLVDPPSEKFLSNIFWTTKHEREQMAYYRGDLLDILAELKNKTITLDDTTIVAQVVQFFMAGFETTGSLISYMLYELSLHLDVQTCLRRDIEKCIEKHGKITYEAIHEMEYLDIVVKESLRLYPTVPFLIRACTKDYKLPGTDLTINEGIRVFISLLGLHKNPQYFPDPLKFNPERFRGQNASKIHQFAYLPFGDGLRNCIGARFGLLATKVAIVQIIRNFQLNPVKETVIPIKFSNRNFLLAPTSEIILQFTTIQ